MRRCKQLFLTRLDRALAQLMIAKVHPDTRRGTDAIVILTAWSTPTLYRRCKAGQFPRPISPGKWHGGAVLAHQAEATAEIEVAPAHLLVK